MASVQDGQPQTMPSLLEGVAEFAPRAKIARAERA